MTIKVRESRGLHGRLYMGGKKYKVVDRPAETDDEVSKAHASQLVEIGAADKVTNRLTRPMGARRTRKAKAEPEAKPPADEPGTKARD